MLLKKLILALDNAYLKYTTPANIIKTFQKLAQICQIFLVFLYFFNYPWICLDLTSSFYRDLIMFSTLVKMFAKKCFVFKLVYKLLNVHVNITRVYISKKGKKKDPLFNSGLGLKIIFFAQRFFVRNLFFAVLQR